MYLKMQFVFGSPLKLILHMMVFHIFTKSHFDQNVYIEKKSSKNRSSSIMKSYIQF